MKKHLLSLFALVVSAQMMWAASETPADQIPAYYSDVDGNSAGGLWSAVHATAKVGFGSLAYGDLWTSYATTDVYPTDPSHPEYVPSKAGQIWDMYSNCTFVYGPKKSGGNQCGSYSKECDCYNREHSIPKSWFGGSDSKGTPGTDIFHIVPTDGKVNGMRSNNAFGEVGSASYTYNGSKLGSGLAVTIENTMLGASTTSNTAVGQVVFEPQDQYKGDFARGYFGTLLRWAGDYQDFTSVEGAMMFSGQYTAAGHWGLTEYGLALLLKWHREDPVSRKEIDRNNGIQKTQGNRNPFIDYPYLAEYIWGEKAGETVDLSQLMPSTDPEFIPGRSNGWRGGEEALKTPDTHVETRKLLINGQLYLMVGEQMYNLQGQRVK